MVAEEHVHTGAVDGATVLVVDDDPAVVRMLRTLFEQNGCYVLVACNGLDAIAVHARHGGVDLIVSDIDMPTMDGLRMCRWLEANGTNARVIIISALDVDPEEVLATASPVVGFLPKPFEMTTLLNEAMATMAR